MGTVTGLKLSSSSRSYFSLVVSGITYNFEDLGFLIKSYQGAGLPQLSNAAIPYGTRGWESYQGTTVNPRLYILVGVIEGDTLKEVTQKRQALINLLAPTSGIAPLVYLAYQLIDPYGSAVGKKLTVPVHYVGGLEGNIDNIWEEALALTFIEHAPSQITDSTVNTSTYPLGTLLLTGSGGGSVINQVWSRNNGVWSRQLDNTVSYTAMLYDATGDLWTTAGSNVYRKSNGNSVYHAISPAINPINTIAQGPDSFMYFAGDGAGTAYPQRQDQSTHSWQLVGNTPVLQVYDSLVIPHPTISGSTIYYITGGFTVPQNRIASIIHTGSTANTGAWSSLGTGLNGAGYTLAYHPNGSIYVGGNFTTFNGVTCNYIGQYDVATGTISALGSGLNGSVSKINVLSDGRLLVSGAFTTAGGKAANKQAYWDGYNWEAVPGSNPNNVPTIPTSGVGIQNTIVDPQTGNYITTSSSDDQVFNGVDWVYGDMNWTNDILDWAYKPTDNTEFTILNQDNFSSQYLSQGLTITNTSTHEVWPQIKIVGNPLIKSIINYTTGKMISFKGTARAFGPTAVATLQCGGPGGLSATSTLFGDITNAIAKGSDLTDFNLKPGVNYMGVLVLGATDASNYVQFVYQNQYWSLDASTIGA